MIAEQISEMQIQNSSMREENDLLRIDVAVLSQENQSLRMELNRARANAQMWMLKCTEVQTLIESTSLSLVHGLSRIKDAKRAAQEESLGVNSRTAPEFLRQEAPRDESETVVRKVMFPTPQDEKPYRFGGGAQVRTDIEDDRLPRVAP